MKLILKDILIRMGYTKVVLLTKKKDTSGFILKRREKRDHLFQQLLLLL
jgi:hypothetical protein